MATYEIVFKRLLPRQSAEVGAYCAKLRETVYPLLNDCITQFDGPFFHPKGKPWTFSIKFRGQCADRVLAVIGRTAKSIPGAEDLVSHLALKE